MRQRVRKSGPVMEIKVFLGIYCVDAAVFDQLTRNAFSLV